MGHRFGSRLELLIFSLGKGGPTKRFSLTDFSCKLDASCEAEGKACWHRLSKSNNSLFHLRQIQRYLGEENCSDTTRPYQKYATLYSLGNAAWACLRRSFWGKKTDTNNCLHTCFQIKRLWWLGWSPAESVVNNLHRRVAKLFFPCSSNQWLIHPLLLSKTNCGCPI